MKFKKRILALAISAAMLLGGTACLPSSSYYIFGCLTANAAETVSYLDSKGNEQFCTEYTQLTDRTTLDAGWYVVSSSVIISDRITVNGDVHIILVDGKKLQANNGINVSEGNSLTIYAQSTGDSMGMLEATGISSAAGIGGQNGAGGTVTINGGTVEAVADGDCNNAIGAGYNNNDNGTLTVSPKANQSLYVKKGESAENAESIDGSPFTEHQDNIIDKVQSNKYVKTVEANAPAYTVTIPAKVNLGETSTISADNVSVLNDFKLIVSLTKINENDKDLKLTTNDGTELKYSITNTSNNSDVKLNSTVLSLPGGTNNGSTTLSFNEPPENEVQYAGNYKGNVTFTISIK